MNPVQLALHVATAQRLLYALDCPRALTVSIMLDHEMYKEILELPVSFDYVKSDDFFRAYQATKLLSKAKWLPTGIDKRAKAETTFWDAENTCRVVNETFASARSGEAQFVLRDAPALINKVKRKIADVLGPLTYDWVYDCNFGPGADQSTVRGFTAAYNKLDHPGSCSFSAMPYLRAYIDHSMLARTLTLHRTTRLPEVGLTDGNRVAFVPKSSKTDRSIAVEPRWNIFFQKGVGKFLRKRLARFGIDLDDQTRNQRLAEEGSRTGRYATIDLKSASDSVSREVIWDLLPYDWAALLDDLRSRSGRLESRRFVYEKWSSMGNGYTFELESVLFYAICSAYTDDLSVYGDDLIVPSEHYHEIVEALFMFGFTTNSEKSFSRGPFRESCGADFFNGVQCTPIYWKEELNVEGTLRLVNQISRLAARLGYGWNRNRGFRRAHADLVRRLPKHFQVRGPTSLATVVHDSTEFWTGRRRWGWDGWHLKVTVPVPLRFQFSHYEAAVIHSLLAGVHNSVRIKRAYKPDVAYLSRPDKDGYSVRDRTRLRTIEVFVPSGHEEVGPWA